MTKTKFFLLVEQILTKDNLLFDIYYFFPNVCFTIFSQDEYWVCFILFFTTYMTRKYENLLLYYPHNDKTKKT